MSKRPVNEPAARVSVQLVAPFVAASDALGLPVDLGLAQVGLERKNLEDLELRVSHFAVERLIRLALSVSNERDLGLLAAGYVEPKHLHLVEYAARAQPTLGKAIESLMRFHTLLHDGVTCEFKISGDKARWSFQFGALRVSETIHEFAAAVYLSAGRRATGLDGLVPLEVRFPHARPKNTTRHQEIFRCRITWGANETAMIFPKANMDLPLATADKGLAVVLDKHADEVLQKLGRTTSFTEHVRQLVSRDLASGQPQSDAIAKSLAMSSRTLHRRLVDEGTSYREVVDQVRHGVALRYLRDPSLSVREVGFLLGFTTGPAFHRAFRRWTGTTAAAYRGQLKRV